MEQSVEPKILAAIDEAVKQGIPLQYIAYGLVTAGWPQGMVNDAINTWLRLYARGRMHGSTDFTNWLKKYKQHATPYLSTIFIVNVVGVLLILLRPWPTKILADSAFGSQPAPWFLNAYTHTPTLILIVAGLQLVIFLVGVGIGLLKDYLILAFGFRLNRELKHESFRHILHLPLYHQQRLAKGDYVYRQNIVTNSLADLVLGTASSINESIVLIVLVLGIMLLLNVQLTIIGVILVPFIFLIIKYFGPRVARLGRALNENASKTSATITESVDNAETVQAFVLEDAQLQSADNLWRQNFQITRRLLLWSKFFRGTNSLLIVLGTSTVMYFGGTMALDGQMTLGELLIFMTYMNYLLSPIENLATQLAVRGQKKVDIHRVFEVVSDHEGIEDLRKDRPFPISTGNIELRNVSYAYGANAVLNNIYLTIAPGEKVAFVGPSGGGKSTLLKLLPLFVEPTAGQILVDGVDIQTISLKELRQNIAWMSQSPQLFNKPMISNLADGDLYHQISYQEVNAALQAANVNEFLGKLPMGIETPTGEGGGSLSGGQRQRVAIARALLKKAPILCMDEPTAALDYQSENVIKDSLKQYLQNRTVLLVTHRKALLSLMDTIYVVEAGSVKNVKLYGGIEAYLAHLEGIQRDKPQADQSTGPDTHAALQAARSQLLVQPEQAVSFTGQVIEPGVPLPAGVDYNSLG